MVVKLKITILVTYFHGNNIEQDDGLYTSPTLSSLRRTGYVRLISDSKKQHCYPAVASHIDSHYLYTSAYL